MKRRGSGLLLHITSLPSPFGIGDMGPAAYRFTDFLADAKQGFWQMLPLNPIDPAYGNSPYHSVSAFAGNPLLISPELMVEDDFIPSKEIKSVPHAPAGRVDYPAVIQYKKYLFHLAYERFCTMKKRDDYERFCVHHTSWLDDFTLFIALKGHFKGNMWSQWPVEIRDRQFNALRSVEEELHETVEREKFLQYLFFRQWKALKQYCNDKDIQVIGDIPIYVDYDSVDVWTTPEIFKLDEQKRPSFVAGVPPDYFSATGQLWGNPVYQWNALKERKYDWWVHRLERMLDLFDVVRIDHFRGLVAYWEVPAAERTAVNGQWIKAPAEDFFNTLFGIFPSLPVIAEDLGVITPDVREIMRQFGLPGMKVLLFAFGEENPLHPYLPHTYERQAVVYTGTHDNNTIKGWFENEAKPKDRERLFRYLGRAVSTQDIAWELIRLAMSSVANLAVIPMQDILGLGAEARMNLPGTGDGNWEWQLMPGQLTTALADKLRELTQIYGRI